MTPVRKAGPTALILATLFGLCLYSPQSFAAWTQPRGEGLVITTFSTYHADARFDALGGRAEAGGYTKQEVSAYGVYGLTAALTLGAQPVFTRVRANSPAGGGRRTLSGVTQMEIFARRRMAYGEDWIFSAQALVKFSGQDAVDREPLLESNRREMEARLLYGRSGRLGKTLRDLEYFSSVETGLRARSNDAADQWRADAAVGVRFRKHYQLIGQSINSISLRRAEDSDPSAFDLYKAQISLLRDLPGKISVQLGASREYAGRNISAGDTLFIAIWSRF